MLFTRGHFIMCAIFGVIGGYCSNDARVALSTMQHRGPDYCSVIEKERLFFAHNRLSIIDVGSRSHQPFQHKNTFLSFNGEIYNYKELRESLNYNFTTQSDTEVILAAYLQYGVDFVNHLRGMFAIAILDDETLYLFRDRFGKKPLYYYCHADMFVFASEIKAIRPFLKHIRMNNDALMSYLSFLAPTAPHTFYEGICKLEPGSYLKYENNNIHVKSYYDVLSSVPKQNQSIEKILQESIDLRLQADVPIASLLSGGIDSAMIAAMSQKSVKDFTTFTLGYDEFASYDECDDADQTANFLGVNNRSLIINQSDFLEAIPRVFDAMDEPLNDPASVPLYLLFEAIKKEGYRVVLSGEGSDEIFLGYRHYREYYDIEQLSKLKNKNWLKRYFRSNFSMNREWEWYKRLFNDTLLFRTSGEKFTDLQKNMLFKKNIKDNQAYQYLDPYREKFLNSPYSDDETIWYSYIDLKIFQAEHFLTKLDRVSMAHSIESRTPFLDHKLVEQVFNLHVNDRLGSSGTKSVLKKIAKSYLNDSIITRKKKGFSNPYMEYLTRSNEIALITEVNKEIGFFRDDVLKKYIDMGKKGRFKHHVWGLYTLAYWMKKNLL
ncbi:MAG: asparagine synthase (glutamine-hydrolyzing) [Campylobacterota bacterium]|nr:asparagine synthase (glutamine-hydrolyzing) [Campylobacterota bacterium]